MMKRRSLLGSLLGLPVGVALAKAPQPEVETAPEDDARIEFHTTFRGALRPRPWTPVVPEMRHGDVVLHHNGLHTYRWMRMRAGA